MSVLLLCMALLWLSRHPRHSDLKATKGLRWFMTKVKGTKLRAQSHVMHAP